MRRREPAAPPAASYVVPAALRIGRCIEVWAEDGKSYISAWRRSRDGRAAWCASVGLSDQNRESWRVLPLVGGVYSLADQVAAGYRDHYVERFAAAGVTFDDIPALRAEADRLVPRRPA